MIEADLAQLIDDHRGVRKWRLAQESIRECRLPAAEEPGEQCHRNPLATRYAGTHSGWPFTWRVGRRSCDRRGRCACGHVCDSMQSAEHLASGRDVGVLLRHVEEIDRVR